MRKMEYTNNEKENIFNIKSSGSSYSWMWIVHFYKQKIKINVFKTYICL